MINDPKEFVNMSLDTCDRQSSYIVKTQAAKFFEAICDNIQSGVTLSSFFSIQAINQVLSKQSGKEPLKINKVSKIIND